MGKQKVSMQSIADELNISKVTVSKALNDKEGVGEELKNRIKELARQKGYKLPEAALQRTGKIGIIMNTRFATEKGEGKLYIKMYESIVKALDKNNYSSMMLTPTPDSVDKDAAMITESSLFDGIIILGLLEHGIRDKMQDINLPKVYVDIYDRTHQSDSVVTENIYSMYEMTKYVIGKGHREIGFVGTVEATTSITDRYLGFLRAMYEKQLPVNAAWVIPDRTMDGAAMDLVLPEKLPGVFICNCDEAAFRLIRELNARGLRVPEDVSVAGFDNDIFAEVSHPQLTTVAVNTRDIGSSAAKLMVRNIEHPGKKHEIRRINGELIIRDSVKEVSSHEKKEKV